MANVYVRSGAGGAGTGADWTNAYTTLAAALTAKAAGDDFWVSEDHAETQASAITCTSPGTASNPCRVICVNHAGTVPPVSADLATTATISTTGVSSITLTGYVRHCYGITFSCGDAANTASILFSSVWNLKRCALVIGNSSGSSIIRTGQNVPTVWDNTTVQFGGTGQTITVNGSIWEWKNTASAVAGATIPSSLFSANSAGTAILRGIDLSALVSKNLVAANAGALTMLLENCALATSGTPTIKLASQNSPTATVITSHVSASNQAINYDHTKDHYYGAQTIETTIVRTGGASDGTQAIAWKIITGTAAKWSNPYVSLPIAIWNDTTASNVTVTVYGIWGGGAVPNNDDIWIEIEYLGSSSNPLATIANTTKADALASNGAVSADASSWGGSTTAFKLTKTLSSPQPAMKGPMIIRVFATATGAGAAQTFYIDPKAVLS